MQSSGPDAVYALWHRELQRLRRSPSRLIGGVAMPMLFMVFLELGFGAMEIGGLPAGIDYIQYMVPGILGMTVLFSGSMAGMSLLWDREHGFLKEVMVAPTSRLSIVVGRIAGGGTLSLLQALLVLAVSVPLGFDVASLAGLAIGIGFLALITVTFIGMGMIFASTMHDSQGFGMVMNLVIFPLFFLSGAIFPIQSLPIPLQYLSYLNPLTYGIDGMRAGLTGVASHGLLIDAVAMLIATTLLLGIGTRSFQRMEVV